MIAAMLLLMSAFAWRRRGRVSEAETIALMMAAAGIYSLGYAQELAQTTLDGACFWLHIEYLGIPWIPALWIRQACRHVGRRIPFWLLLIIPILTLIGQWSDSVLHLYNNSIHLVGHGPFLVVEAERGILGWLNVGYLYFSVLFSIGIYLTAIRQGYRRLRIQQAMFLGGCLPPTIGYLFYVTGHSPWGLDLAPFAMNISALMGYVAIFDMECFDLVPMARSQVFHSMRDAAFVTDLRYRLVDFNPAAVQLVPGLDAESLGQPLDLVLNQSHRMQALFQSSARAELLEMEQSGEPHTFEVRVLPLGERLNQTGWAMILADITDQTRMLQELQRNAETDSLTGVANRRHFLSILEREAMRMLRHPEPYSLLVIDVDHFKEINDSWGHSMGDLVLCEVIRTITRCLRATDTLGRLGGDEFVLLLPHTSLQQAHEVAERIRATTSAMTIPAEGRNCKVTLSLGVASWNPEHSLPWAEVLESADRALYQAKSAGRNQVSVL